MFIVSIYNRDTSEEFREEVQDQKDLDAFVESLHNVYGDSLQINIAHQEEQIETKRCSDRPVCPNCFGKKTPELCKICGSHYLSVELPSGVWMLT